MIELREDKAVKAITQTRAKTKTREVVYLMTKERNTGTDCVLYCKNSSFNSALLISDISDIISTNNFSFFQNNSVFL